MKLLINQIQTYLLVLLICQAACVRTVIIFCKKQLEFKKTVVCCSRSACSSA